MTDDQRARRGDVYVRLVTGLVIGGVVLAARWYWNQLVAAHVPYVDYDTQVFTQIADRPLGGGLLFAPKPLVVPLVYRLAGNDPGRVVGFQDALAFVSWSLVAVILALGRRRLWVRPIAAAIGMAFVFAPTRVGFTASLMPESIDDSLLALTVASALALGCLRGRSRAAAMVAMGLFAAIWMLTRDTNVFIALAAVVVAMIVWRGWRARRVWLAAACVIGAAAGVLATTCVAHEPLPYQHDWYARFTPRGVYPLLDNVTIRVDDLRDQLPAELASSADRTIQVEWLVRAAPRPLQDWFVDRGGGVYARWLVRHPIDRVGELVEARWTVLASSLATYMPRGWVSGGGWLRRLTRQHTVLLVLVLA
ncbi:MAG TPA: hypothetical protein VGO00_27865, partial [Kofleriaceae bacterium]|nr:hypothetical protein [Kofleriaceae bacterium]